MKGPDNFAFPSAHKKTRRIMKKNNINIEGNALICENCFAFAPAGVQGQVTNPYTQTGVARLSANGAFDFEVRAQSTLIKKVAHGRLSATHDGAIQLTLKVFKTEGIDILRTLQREVWDATQEVEV